MISKELLSEVLGTDLTSLGKVSLEDAHLCLWDSLNDSPYMAWNIHELAHKCKEWAWKQGYIINSHYAQGDCYARANNMVDFSIDGKGKSEPEAIFKACQWILENKDR